MRLLLYILVLLVSVSCSADKGDRDANSLAENGDKGKESSESISCSQDKNFGKHLWTREFSERNLHRRHPMANIFSCGGNAILKNRNSISRINPTSGKTIWSVGASGVSGPRCNDSSLFFGSSDGVKSVDAETGNVNWTYKIDGSNFRPALSEDMVYFKGVKSQGEMKKGYLYAVSPSSQRVIWKGEVKGGPFYFISYSSGVVLLVSSYSLPHLEKEGGEEEIVITAYNSKNGSVIWRRSYNESTNTKPVIKDGKIFLKSINEYSEVEEGFEQKDLGETHIRKIDLKNGSVLWDKNIGNTSTVSGMSVDENNLYFLDNNLNIVDVSEGRIAEEYEVGKLILRSTPLIVGNYIYVGAEDGRVIKINMEEGKMNTRSTRSPRVIEKADIIDNVFIYISSRSDMIAAICR